MFDLKLLIGRALCRPWPKADCKVVLERDHFDSSDRFINYLCLCVTFNYDKYDWLKRRSTLRCEIRICTHPPTPYLPDRASKLGFLFHVYQPFGYFSDGVLELYKLRVTCAYLLDDRDSRLTRFCASIRREDKLVAETVEILGR